MYHEMNHAASGVTTFAMAALNTGFCVRHQARDTLDYKAITIYWNSVSSPGVVTLRIETIDPATGKPSLTLYDAAATKTFTPVAGLQTITFDTLPTAGRTVGASYAILLLTTTGGTIQTLRAYHGTNIMQQGAELALTAADGTTRTNFADVAQSWPMMSMTYEDNSIEARPFSPGVALTGAVTGNAAFGGHVYLPAGFRICGAEFPMMASAAPNSNLKISLLDCSKEPCAIGATGYVVASCTLDKDSLTTYNYPSSPRGMIALFDAEYTVAASGLFRIIVEKSDHAGTVTISTYSISYWTADHAPQYWLKCGTSDITASPITWTDTTTDLACVGLLVSNFEAPASGGGGSVFGSGVLRGGPA
jgi:hypothetical protein